MVPPPEGDTVPAQRNPILEDSLQDELNLFFDSPDNNAAAILHNHPAMTAYVANDHFAFDLDASTLPNAASNWHYPHPQFDHATSSSTFAENYSQPFPLGRTNANTRQHPSILQSQSHMAGAAPQPPHEVYTNYGLGVDAPKDVVDAATKLFEYRTQKNASTLHSHPSDASPQPGFHQQLPSHERRTSQLYRVSASAQPQSFPAAHYVQSNGHLRSSVDASAAYSPPANMQFASNTNSYPTAQPYHFGSDSNFNQHGYSGPYQQLNEQSHLEFARTMAPYGDRGAPSAASSHPQSPVTTRQDANYQPLHFQPRPALKQEPSAEDYGMPNPSKRRRTIVACADGEESRFATYIDPSPAINDKSSPDANDGSPTARTQSSPDIDDDVDDDDDDDVPNNPRKRRKSSSTAQARANAAARKNLTEEQKRENHIKSEQKRRNIIKDGYKNLNELVTNLKQGGFSKSATLTETVRELETLQEANKNSRLRIISGLGISPDELKAMMDAM